MKQLSLVNTLLILTGLIASLSYAEPGAIKDRPQLNSCLKIYSECVVKPFLDNPDFSMPCSKIYDLTDEKQCCKENLEVCIRITPLNN